MFRKRNKNNMRPVNGISSILELDAPKKYMHADMSKEISGKAIAHGIIDELFTRETLNFESEMIIAREIALAMTQDYCFEDSRLNLLAENNKVHLIEYLAGTLSNDYNYAESRILSNLHSMTKHLDESDIRATESEAVHNIIKCLYGVGINKTTKHDVVSIIDKPRSKKESIYLILNAKPKGKFVLSVNELKIVGLLYVGIGLEEACSIVYTGNIKATIKCLNNIMDEYNEDNDTSMFSRYKIVRVLRIKQSDCKLKTGEVEDIIAGIKEYVNMLEDKRNENTIKEKRGSVEDKDKADNIEFITSGGFKIKTVRGSLKKLDYRIMGLIYNGAKMEEIVSGRLTHSNSKKDIHESLARLFKYLKFNGLKSDIGINNMGRMFDETFFSVDEDTVQFIIYLELRTVMDRLKNEINSEDQLTLGKISTRPSNELIGHITGMHHNSMVIKGELKLKEYNIVALLYLGLSLEEACGEVFRGNSMGRNVKTLKSLEQYYSEFELNYDLALENIEKMYGLSGKFKVGEEEVDRILAFELDDLCSVYEKELHIISLGGSSQN